MIKAINGQPVSDTNTLRNRVAATQPGSEVTLTIVRDGREQQVRASLGEFTPENARGEDEEGGGGGGDRRGSATSRLGISVEALTPELSQRLRLPAGTQGVVVTEVDPSGPAAIAGLQERDVMSKSSPALRSSRTSRAGDRSVARPVCGSSRAVGTPS